MAVEAIQLGFNCHECDEQLKRERGCFDKGLIPFDMESGRVFRCPLKLVSDMSWQYVQAFSFYRKNLLPNGSVYLRETQKYIDAMFVIEKEYAMIESEQIKKIKK